MTKKLSVPERLRRQVQEPSLPGTQPWRALINELKQFCRVATRHEKQDGESF